MSPCIQFFKEQDGPDTEEGDEVFKEESGGQSFDHDTAKHDKIGNLSVLLTVTVQQIQQDCLKINFMAQNIVIQTIMS